MKHINIYAPKVKSTSLELFEWVHTQLGAFGIFGKEILAQICKYMNRSTVRKIRIAGMFLTNGV
jgi:hypothetical protein